MNNGTWKLRNRAKKWYRVRFSTGTYNDICYTLRRHKTAIRYIDKMWHWGCLYDGRKFLPIWWNEDAAALNAH